MSMQLLKSERPRDAIAGHEWMESSLLLAWTCWGSWRDKSNIQGLCVVIRGAISIVLIRRKTLKGRVRLPTGDCRSFYMRACFVCCMFMKIGERYW